NLSGNKLYVFPELGSLKNLEYINLSSNDIYDTIPESLNELENLKYFDVADNKAIKGKILTNSKIEECFYSSFYSKYELCIPKGYEIKCLNEDSFMPCEEENIDVNSDGKCGEGYGKCPTGQCCNKDGQCGTSNDYCLISKKCQIKYGNCIDECSEIFSQMRNMGEDVDSIRCTADEEGRAQNCTVDLNNFKSLKNNEKITSL
ncbi:carbohydrate-binding module family 18 protein, partial [Piromyces sp. E2]